MFAQGKSFAVNALPQQFVSISIVIDDEIIMLKDSVVDGCECGLRCGGRVG